MNGLKTIAMDSQNGNGGFNINVNCPGNFIAQSMTFTAPIYISGDMQHGGFSEEQIKAALEAVVGQDKVINRQWKWAGAYWYLRWACNYPVDIKEFCEKIDAMQLDIASHLKCQYESIRKICKMSFMDYDPKKMDQVKYSRLEADVFAECRGVVQKLAEELGKTYLPKE